PYIQIIAVPIVVLLTGLVTWLVGKLFDSVQSLRASMMVSTYAMFIKLPGLVAAALIAYFSDPSRLNGPARITLGLGALLDPDKTSPLLIALLTRVDVFTIWQTVLLAIGLQVTGKVTRSQSYLAAVIIWLIGVLPTVLPALRG
ncbi:MAG TPA: YIP1 family protein, partial [Gemmatimonadaceae bacterium]|nr:YIP1 family protein [Gemmatimonadaceae bacterium]